jgi:hypothetical protein
MALITHSALERRYGCNLGFNKSARLENEPYQFVGAAPAAQLKGEIRHSAQRLRFNLSTLPPFNRRAAAQRLSGFHHSGTAKSLALRSRNSYCETVSVEYISPMIACSPRKALPMSAPKTTTLQKSYGDWNGFVKTVHGSIGRNLGGGKVICSNASPKNTARKEIL